MKGEILPLLCEMEVIIMSRQSVTESEYELMKVLWEANEPMAFGDILKAVSDKNWARNTVGTMLSRLCDKGAAGFEKRGKANFYYAVLKKKDYNMGETKSFLSRLYNGSVGSLVASLYENKEISQEEIENLRKIIGSDK